MKKVAFVVSFFTLICITAFGQDIIVTKDAKKIEATITEVNVDDIKYKLFSNPNGPVYTTLKSDISSVIYQNGQVETFEQKVSKSSSKSNISSEKYGFLQMSDSEQEEYLSKNDYDLYTKFHKGQSLTRTGKGLRIPGWIFLGGGLGLMLASPLTDGDASEVVAIGAAFFSAGNVLILTSIPISAIGGGVKKKVQNEYQVKYLGQSNPKGQFQLQVSGNGLGLAYVF